MKNLIKRHQAATWERGLITPTTTLIDFMDKLDEECIEFRRECANMIEDERIEPTPELIHETIDIIAVAINMLTFYGVDFIAEYRKNVEYQESRI